MVESNTKNKMREIRKFGIDYNVLNTIYIHFMVTNIMNLQLIVISCKFQSSDLTQMINEFGHILLTFESNSKLLRTLSPKKNKGLTPHKKY